MVKVGLPLSLDDVERVARGAPVVLDDGARNAMRAARDVVDRIVAAGKPVYGVNTGFGALARVRVADGDLDTLQLNLVRSHAVGVGPPFDVATTRALMLLRAQVLALGHSGVREAVVDTLLALLLHGIHPIVPSQGSVGASGDLAPLAHLALLLIGEGDVHGADGPEPASEALRRAGLTPLTLRAKEGLALVNGTQAMTAIGALAVQRARRLLRTADAVAALTLEAHKGSIVPFDARLHAVRPHPGQAAVAGNLRRLLDGGTVGPSHVDCDKVQDPYSLRCMPQVHGAARDAVEWAAAVLTREVGSVTDNPTVFVDTGEVLSGGNFHGEPVAIAMDLLAIAVSELGAISERRVEQLVNSKLSDLPAFLVRGSGLNSGFMMAQVTAAALASENKGLCHPASVDSIPTSANQEDHVSMGPIAARKARAVVENVEQIVAIELLVASQGADFLLPLRPAPGADAVRMRLRRDVETLSEDRALHGDLREALRLVRDGEVLAAAEAVVGELA